MLLYIENKELLTKIIEYLDYMKKNYTLTLEDDYEYVVIADINKKSMEISKGKKIIFVTTLIEKRLRDTYLKNNKRNREYRNRIINSFNQFYQIIVSNDAVKQLLKEKITTNIEVIYPELPTLNIGNTNKYIYDKYKIKKRRKNILFIDFQYEKLDYIYAMSLKYTRFNFIYLGFVADYQLTKKNRSILNKLPTNVYRIKNYDLNIFNDVLKISDYVVNISDLMTETNYLYSIFLFKKIFLSLHNIYYDQYLINSKHIYTFEGMKELFIKFDKIIENRLLNITGIAYDVVQVNTFHEIARKYDNYLP